MKRNMRSKKTNKNTKAGCWVSSNQAAPPLAEPKTHKGRTTPCHGGVGRRHLSAPFLPLAAAAVLGLLIQAAPAQNWQTVDNFQYVVGANTNDAWANGITKDPLGNIYTVGGGVVDEANYYYHAVIRRSTDAGVSWSVIDDFSN